MADRPATIEQEHANVVDLPETASLATRPEAEPQRPQVVRTVDAPAGRTQSSERTIVRHSDQIDQLITALAMAQGEPGYGDIEKTKTARIEKRAGGSFTYTYETLKDVLDATRPFLAKHGVAFMQFPFPARETVTIRTMIAHAGQWLYNDLTATIVSPSPQDVGSGISFLRRYAAKSILGVSAEDEDDDGAAASRVQAAPAPDAPGGYVEWLDDLRACADEGEAALRAMWEKSNPVYRKHLTDTASQTWMDIKATAAKAGKAGR